jgi:hypothetical protein
MNVHGAIASAPRLDDRQPEVSDVPEIETWTLEEIDGLPVQIGQYRSEQEPAQ